MSNRRTCPRCGRPLDPAADRRRVYCAERCRVDAAAAAYRERNREAYNKAKAAAMRERRLAAKRAFLARQAAAHEEHTFEVLTPAVASTTFHALIRQTALWDAARKIDPYERWLREKSFDEEEDARRQSAVSGAH